MVQAVWENRNKVSIKDLDGKELGCTVHLGTRPKAKGKHIVYKFERSAPA